MIGLNDEQTVGRILQLLPSVSANPVDNADSEYIKNDSENSEDVAAQAQIFDDDKMQALWKRGVKTEGDWRRTRDAVKSGERGLPPDLALRFNVNIAECTVWADGVLRGRGNRVWVPDYEPLRTSIIQRVHNSHLAGHPCRDTTIGILLKSWFWPKIRKSVR